MEAFDITNFAKKQMELMNMAGRAAYQGETLEEAQEDYAGFLVDSPEKAAWAAEKIKEEERRRDFQVQTCEAEIERLKRCIARHNEDFEKHTSWLYHQLDAYLDSGNVPTHRTKTQESIEIAGHKIVRKFPKQDYDHDDMILLDKLKQSGANEYVKIKEILAWGELKKHLAIQNNKVIFTDTGEVLDGVRVVEKPGSIEVK